METYRILEKDLRTGKEQIAGSNGSLEQVETRIKTINKFNKTFGVTKRSYKPIKIN